MGDIAFPRGVRDLMPNEALFRNNVVETIESVYRSFGFIPISTPYMESLDVLKAKDVIGEENKLIFELKDQNNGLRYDHTVGLARYISMHRNMPLPFKRYVIGAVWRMDEPQRIRFREFWQGDVDILGGDTVKANAEIIAAVCTAMDRLGVDYTIRLNSRQIVNALMESIGLKESAVRIMRIMDKADKIGMDGVVRELGALGLNEKSIESIKEFVGISGTTEERINAISKSVGDEPCKELNDTIEMLKLYSIKGKVSIDTSLVRGLDYYTGVVMEIMDNTGKAGTSSIAAGGRYDNLVSRFSDAKLPGVGMTIGIDRVLEVLQFSESKKRTYSKVFVAYIKEQNYAYALSVANKLRSSGINTEINSASRNISNQLSYASSLGIPYVLVLGNNEEQNKSVKLRDMESGKEEELKLDDLVKRLS